MRLLFELRPLQTSEPVTDGLLTLGNLEAMEHALVIAFRILDFLSELLSLSHSTPLDDATIIVEVKVRELIQLLHSDGWYLRRTRGSHRQFKHPIKQGTITVAGNLGSDMPRGTLRVILKRAGIGL